MGLDITAYSGLTKRGTEGDAEDDGFGEGGFKTPELRYQEEEWPGRSQGLESSTLYKYDGCDWFSAGPYSYYGWWREMLAKMAGYPPFLHALPHCTPKPSHAAGAWNATSGPFWELIHFSDCEGVLGPVVCAKLAGEFREWEEKARVFSGAIDDERFLREYLKWKSCFELAENNGAVVFE